VKLTVANDLLQTLTAETQLCCQLVVADSDAAEV
jgi:hypothetical protein